MREIGTKGRVRGTRRGHWAVAIESGPPVIWRPRAGYWTDRKTPDFRMWSIGWGWWIASLIFTRGAEPEEER